MNDRPSMQRSAKHPSALPTDAPFGDTDALDAYLTEVFPQWQRPGAVLTVTAIADGAATLRLAHDESHLRPGGTVSGPAMMMLADVAAFAAILTRIGRVPLAVTTSLHIDFLRKPAPGDIVGAARVLKLGKRLAVCRIDILAADDALVAHATATYSVPPTAG